MRVFLYNAFVLLVGALLALQGVINGRLARYLEHPIHAAVVSFSIGLCSLIALSFMLGAPLPQLSQVKSIPWYLFVGGIFGAIMVSSAIIFIPKLGVATFIGGIIVGQLLAALLMDHFGILGLETKPIDMRRTLGASFLILGFFLTRK